MTEYVFHRGDRVALLDLVPGRPQLRPGLVGIVEVGDEQEEIWGMISTTFPGTGGRVWRLHRRHLRPVGSEGDLL